METTSLFCEPQLWSTLGLGLDILGVGILFCRPPRGYVPVGGEGRLLTGGPGDTRWSRIALGLIGVGFGLQILAVWL